MDNDKLSARITRAMLRLLLGRGRILYTVITNGELWHSLVRRPEVLDAIVEDAEVLDALIKRPETKMAFVSRPVEAMDIATALIKGPPDDLTKQVIDELIQHHAETVIAGLNKTAPFNLRQESYSQEGEDLVLKRIFGNRSNGFYVDVGAHHPIRFSNTYLLYRQGWHGINIDATPNSMESFRKFRPRDLNIECLVSAKDTERSFYMFNEPALNTVSIELANERSGENPYYEIERMVQLPARRLDSILAEYLPAGQKIDFFNVDVEGADFDVLESNDWERYAPKFVLVEMLGVVDGKVDQHKIARYLHGLNYQIVAKFFNTVLFEVKP
jgi:FkbM family methyltransferase